MREWFKARNIWGAALVALSDEEAGRLAKAIWTYTMTGQTVDIDGAGKGIFALIQMTLAQDEERDTEISAKRSLASKSRIMASADSNAVQMPSNDNNCNQLISNDDNKNKNKSKNKNIEQEKDNRRFTPPSLQEVADYCRERKNGIDAQHFIDFYASKGWKVGNQPMKDWKACIRTWEQRDRQSPSPAGEYRQRDYSGKQNEATQRMLAMLEDDAV